MMPLAMLETETRTTVAEVVFGASAVHREEFRLLRLGDRRSLVQYLDERTAHANSLFD
jgi:hypothetical protein